ARWYSMRLLEPTALSVELWKLRSFTSFSVTSGAALLGGGGTAQPVSSAARAAKRRTGEASLTHCLPPLVHPHPLLRRTTHGCLDGGRVARGELSHVRL